LQRLIISLKQLFRVSNIHGSITMAQSPLTPYIPWIGKIGIELQQGPLKLLETYLGELCRWNIRINLVGPSSPDRIVRELVLDSLVPFPLLPAGGSLLDVGSGAGLPALPLKICGSEIEFLLVEPVQKRVNFLKHVIRKANLKDISVTRGRVEPGAFQLNPAGYDVVTARAVAPFARTIRLCGPHAAPGGMLLTFHGQAPEKVLEESSEEIKEQDLVVEKLIPYRLPGFQTARHLAVLRKKGLQGEESGAIVFPS
jgi:16S rRNA (guanine527-N7)-methyltransferase